MHYAKRLAWSLATGVMITGLLFTLTATAQASEVAEDIKITAFDVGFGSTYRVGNWTPVRVTLQTEKGFHGSLSVIVPDGDGVPSRVTKDVALADHETKTYMLYVRFGRVHSEVTVVAEAPDRDSPTISDKAFYRPDAKGPYHPAVSAENSLVVIVGQETAIIDAAIRVTNKTTADHIIPSSVSNPSELPDNWIGYDGVDTLILSLSNPAVAEMFFTSNDPQTLAIDRWVRQGGRLVLFSGELAPEWIKLAKKNYDPATSLLPGKPVDINTLKRVTSIETYVDTHAAIPLPSGQHRHKLPVFKLSNPQGTTEARSGKTSLVVRSTHGFGTVTFLAVNPNAPPLDKWRDQGQLVRKLLDMPERSIDISESSGGAVRHFGYTDLSGQMRSALDRFEGVAMVSFTLIVLILLIYIVLIGPADYYLLKKIGRMSWTWITFTLIVVLFGVGTFWFAYQMKGDQLRLHRVDLIDIDVAGKMVRGTSWANLFSPKGKRYDLSFSSNLSGEMQAKEDSIFLSWLGLPGRGLGGMNPHAAEASTWREPYDFLFNHDGTDCKKMDRVPLLNWSTKSFTVRWSAPWNDDFEFDLREEDELPVGRVTNPLKDQRLENCLLIYDRWAYKLDTLEPGESATIDGIRGRMRLNTLLTERKMLLDDDEKTRESITPYETESTDPAYILRRMMFYKAAGGERYVRLSNRYQPFVDLSNLLAPGRAMLVGQLPADAPAVTNFTVDGQAVESDQHTTVFRFIIPVKVKK